MAGLQNDLNASRGSDLWDLVWASGEKVVGEAWGPGAPNAIERIESGLFSWGTEMIVMPMKSDDELDETGIIDVIMNMMFVYNSI